MIYFLRMHLFVMLVQQNHYIVSNFSRAFVFLTGVFYESDPQVDIFIKGSKPSDLKILSTVVLKFLDISDDIQTLDNQNLNLQLVEKENLEKKKI